MATEESLHLIDGEDASGPGLFDVHSPETGNVVSRAGRCTPEIVDCAIASAAEAFNTWRKSSYIQRRDLLLRAADILASYETDIVRSMVAETGSKRDWALGGNVRGACSVLREVASMASQVKGEVLTSANPGTMTLVTREPAGVVLAIAPWNSPVILSCRAVAVAILCGNTVILKSSEHSPRSQRYVAEAFRAAGFPKGVLNYLNMAPQEAPELTERIIAHPAVRRVNFTGSDHVGRIIAHHCVTYGPKQCVLELGGKAPAIVLEDADLDAAADAIVFSAMMHSGQICYSTETVIAVGRIADPLVEKLRSRIQKLWAGPSEEGKPNGRPEQFRLGPLFRESAARNAVALLEDAQAHGAHILIGDVARTGCFVQPHLIDNLPRASRLSREESFAPFLAVARAASPAAALALANAGDFSLTAAVYGADGYATLELAQEIKAGAVHVNGPTVSFESNRPYGGLGGASGYGRFGGTAGIEEYTDRKVVTTNRPGGVHVSLV